MRILYLSDSGPYSSTFIRQDVEYFSQTQEAFYGCFISDKDYPGKTIGTKVLDFPQFSLMTRIKDRLEKKDILLNMSDSGFAERLQNLINEFKPDIIHSQFTYEGVKFFDNIKTDIPVVTNFRGYDASSKLRKNQYVKKLKKILSSPTVYPVFVCKALRNNLEQKQIPVRPDHLILYTGIQLNRFKKENRTLPEAPVFIQVSSFDSKKGHDVSIRAFRKFIEQTGRTDAQLIFVGSGKTFEASKQLTAELGLTQNIQFLGNLQQSEIIPLLDKASVFIHHSLTSSDGNMEGIPNAVIEAMAMELPVLSTYHAGIPEAVVHRVNGLLCQEGDIETFAKQMAEIYTWGYKEENRKAVEKQFSFESHVQKLENFYKFIIAEKKKQQA